MLVLSRKSSEEIVFPAIGITVRVLRTGGNTVKLGIKAPPHLKVIRGELANFDDLIAAIEDIVQVSGTHELRNQLNSLVLKLELLKRAEASGRVDDHFLLAQDATNALAELDHELAKHATPRITPVPHSEAATERYRLLVVDDNANERELLTSVLLLQGFDAYGVADGVEAIASLNENHQLPHAVLLDLDMPRMGGEQTLRCIRADLRFKYLTVVGISGRLPQVQLLPDGFKGFDAWFSKPLQLQQLIDVVSMPTSSKVALT